MSNPNVNDGARGLWSRLTRRGGGGVALFAVGFPLLGALVVLRFLDPAPVQAVRLGYFDLLQRLSPRSYDPELPVRVVDVDEASLRKHGQWPWPRDLLARLVDRLSERGAAVIAFDMLFAEPDRLSAESLARDPYLGPLIDDLGERADQLPNRDLIFADALRRTTAALGTALAAGDEAAGPAARLQVFAMNDGLDRALPRVQSATPVVPVLDSAAAGLGSISVSPDETSATIRTVPLLWKTGDGFIPGLSIEALRLALGEDGIILWDDGENAGALTAIGIGPYDVPVSPDGRFWVHFRKDRPADHIPAHSLIDNSYDGDLAGTIVFVGTSAAGLLDIRTTALGQNVAGVTVHAQIVEQILSGRFLSRSDFAQGLEILVFVTLAAIVISVMSLFGPLVSVTSGAASAAVVAWASWAAFVENGLLLDVTFPLAGGFFVFSCLAVLRLLVLDRHTRFLKRSFSKYVGREVLREVEKVGSRIELGGENREITIMFADIVGFTPLSTTLDPQALVALLNELFTVVGEEILKRQGTIDKYLGDGLMAFWNAPVSVPEHARHACTSALSMQRALETFNREQDGRPIRLGIGLARGEACIGNIGSRDHFNFTAIGERVNAAARIEGTSRTLDYDIAADSSVRQAAPDFAWLEAGFLQLKGMGQARRIHALVGGPELAATPEFQRLEIQHRALMDALARDGDVEAALDACMETAATISPLLAPFYSALASRRLERNASEPQGPARQAS